MSTMLLEESVHKSQIQRRLDDIHASSAISFLGIHKFMKIVQTNFNTLERCDKQSMYFGNKLDKYLNNEYQSLSMQIMPQGIQELCKIT